MNKYISRQSVVWEIFFQVKTVLQELHYPEKMAIRPSNDPTISYPRQSSDGFWNVEHYVAICSGP